MGMFIRCVTDSVNTGYKNHTPPGHLAHELGIMTRAAWHYLVFKVEVFGVFFEFIHDVFVTWLRLQPAQLAVLKHEFMLSGYGRKYLAAAHGKLFHGLIIDISAYQGKLYFAGNRMGKSGFQFYSANGKPA